MTYHLNKYLHSEKSDQAPLNSHLPCYVQVNHIPGTGLITNKEALTTVEPSKYVPKTFSMPQQKEEFLRQVRMRS